MIKMKNECLVSFHAWAKNKGWGIEGEPNPDLWPYAAWIAWQAWKDCWHRCNSEKPFHFKIK